MTKYYKMEASLLDEANMKRKINRQIKKDDIFVLKKANTLSYSSLCKAKYLNGEVLLWRDTTNDNIWSFGWFKEIDAIEALLCKKMEQLK